jgi:hypothetical protein
MINLPFLLLTAVMAGVLCRFFLRRYMAAQHLCDIYYLMGFAVLLVSALLLSTLGMGILASPYVLTVASLIPLGLAMGIAEEHFPTWKRGFKWFALVGFLAIAIASIGGFTVLRKIAVPIFHGGAGLVIILGPFLAKGAAGRFRWVGVAGLLIGIGGMALAFLNTGRALFGLFTAEVVIAIFAPLLFLMTAAFAVGFLGPRVAAARRPDETTL